MTKPERLVTADEERQMQDNEESIMKVLEREKDSKEVASVSSNNALMWSSF